MKQFMFYRVFSLMLIMTLLGFFGPRLQAGILYSERELWAVGDLWKTTQTQWQAEQIRHKSRMKEIDASSMSDKHKDFFRQKETSLHRAESQVLAAKRNQVQKVLINEANARSASGQQSVSDRIDASLGTKIDDPAHSGMASDLDAQGGALTSKKVKETLSDMGLDDIPVKNNAGTLEIGTRELGGDFELVIHKGGCRPKSGSEFQHIINEVDARNTEIFMSERMKNPSAGTKQVGTDYVEVQDHLKKASYGHNSSNKQLVENPDDMQSMVKSTNKTLDMGDVSDDELQSILQRNNIEDTPKEFRKKLQNIKERRSKIKDPAEAGKLREASKDIMATAEKKTYARAKDEIKAKKQQLDATEANLKKLKRMSDNPETAARRKKLQADLEARARSIREELIDSNSKMKATKAANDELRAHPRKQKNSPQKDIAKAPESPDRTTGKSKPDADAGKTPKSPGVDDSPDLKTRIKGKAAKAVDVFGNIMDIADIGNACQKLEDYQEGKAKLKDVIRSVVDLTPAGGLVGASEKVGTSVVDYYQSSKSIKKANETNMEAYLTQWEIVLRKANMSKEDARKFVSNAMLAGNIDVLEAKAEELRIKGKNVQSPRLVLEDTPGPDGGNWYMWENTKELGYGMWDGGKKGVTYIVTAPYRTVTAWSEGELAEATLDYNSKTAESDMKTRLFRSLMDAGIDSKRALRAVQNGGSYLQKTTAEARKNLQAKREKERQIEAERAARQKRIDACHQQIRNLRFMQLYLVSNPVSPIPIPKGTSPDDGIELSVSFDDNLKSAVERIRSEIRSITGQEPSVTTEYQCSIKSAKETKPGTWTIELPAKADLYPVSVTARFKISGLTGEFSSMTRTINRSINGAVQLKDATESITLSKSKYQFYDGDYEEISATLTGAQEGTSYYYQWVVGDTSVITQEPSYFYNAELNGADEKTETLTVTLADRLTGSYLDSANATVTILPLTGTKIVIDETRTKGTKERHQWKINTCKEVRFYMKKDVRNQAKHREFSEVGRKVITGEWCTGDYIQGEPKDPDVWKIYGYRHGPFTQYDYETGTMLEQTGHYRNGKKHGKWVRYETRRSQSIGSVTEITHYLHGKKHGNSKSYLDGWLWADTNWDNGVEHGLHKYYSHRAPGKISSCIEYNQGKRVRGYRWMADPNVGFDRELNKYRRCIYYSKTWYGSDSGKPTERVTVWID